jgi:hypothetical protein
VRTASTTFPFPYNAKDWRLATAGGKFRGVGINRVFFENFKSEFFTLLLVFVRDLS